MTFKNLLLVPLFAMILIAQTGCDVLNKTNISLFHQKDLAANPKEQIVQIVKKETSIQQGISDYLISRHINGSVAIVKQNRVIFNRGLGYADVKNHILNSASTSFAIGSVTKAFVATSIMQLQEKGMLSIQDPISKYLPHFPNGRNIKLVNLLSHTSGLQKPIWHRGETTPLAIIKAEEKKPLLFPAGTKWDYKDVNYIVLGYIVQKVTGTTLHAYIQKNIFDKANMKDSGFITRKWPHSITSNGYKRSGNHLIIIKNFNTYLLFGCGDIYSTALDLTKFDQALFTGKLVSLTSLHNMITPRSISTYGLGLYNYGDRIFSRGVLGGWETLHVYFKDRTAMAILINIRDNRVKIKNIAVELHWLINAQKPLIQKANIS